MHIIRLRPYFALFFALSHVPPLKFVVHLHIYAHYNQVGRLPLCISTSTCAPPPKTSVHLLIYVFYKDQVGSCLALSSQVCYEGQSPMGFHGVLIIS
ncbi:hypothetical protein PILCRDRAFT_10969 [Piloderma croceum F 1598]|uniref:Uncharacterized protein n=1 Tax=Piloderma croceum (strain F 1598) TaxID=765440 RepID=A0A0C3BN67_PILCF|nr:hypothetical protein PILCRDRAFT_10969 [Piloderma croceum F 1598]